MPHYRATIRWINDRQRYHMEDMEARDLFEALDRLRALIPVEVAANADLVELRLQPRADEREREEQERASE